MNTHEDTQETHTDNEHTTIYEYKNTHENKRNPEERETKSKRTHGNDNYVANMFCVSCTLSLKYLP